LSNKAGGEECRTSERYFRLLKEVLRVWNRGVSEIRAAITKPIPLFLEPLSLMPHRFFFRAAHSPPQSRDDNLLARWVGIGGEEFLVSGNVNGRPI